MPQPAADGTARDGKGVSTIELFFDLIFVFAVTRTSELLQLHQTWEEAAMAAVAFVPVFWLWVGTTMYANLTDVDALGGRGVFFAVALSGLVMALALPEAYGGEGLILALAYWWGRLVLLLAVRRHPHRREFITFPVGGLLTGPLLVLGALAPSQWRLLVWFLAAIVDLGTPIVLRRRVVETPFDVGHLAERYATFIIIALGEAVVAIGVAAAGDENRLLAVFGAVLGLAVGWGLWWTYFDLAAPVIARSLAESRIAIDVIRPVLSYAHFAFVCGIVAVAAGIGGAVGAPMEPLSRFGAALLLGGAALFLATFGFTRRRLVRTWAIPRLTGAGVCLLLLPVAARAPALVTLVLLALVLFAVNVVDHLQARGRA